MTPAQKEVAFKKMAEAALYQFELKAYLQPGEALVTREWGGAEGSFLDLHTDFLKAPGTYRVKAVYDDRPSPPPNEMELVIAGLSARKEYEKAKVNEDKLRYELMQQELRHIKLDPVLLDLWQKEKMPSYLWGFPDGLRYSPPDGPPSCQKDLYIELLEFNATWRPGEKLRRAWLVAEAKRLREQWQA